MAQVIESIAVAKPETRGLAEMDLAIADETASLPARVAALRLWIPKPFALRRGVAVNLP